MSRIRPIWFSILLVLAIYAVAVRFSEFQEILGLFKNAQPAWVVVAIILQFGTYIASAGVYHDILHTLAFHVRVALLTRIYLAMSFLTHILPVGAFTGSVYFTRTLKRFGLSQGQGAAVTLVAMVTGYLAFFAMLIFGMIYLIVSRAASELPVAEMGIILGSIVVVFFGIDRMIVHHVKITHWLRHTLEVFHAKERWYLLFDRLATFMTDLAGGRALFIQRKRAFIRPALFQLAVLLLDALTIYVIFFAFRERASLAVIVVAYALARFFGAISFLPGGVGSFEVVQILTLKALGVPLATATLVTLFFRLFSFWLPTPIGFYYYRKLGKEGIEV